MDDKDPAAAGSQSESGDYGYKMQAEPERKLPDEDKPQWHVATRSGNQFGPWPLVELKRRAENGELAADDLVWRAGLPDWRPASELPELASYFGGAAVAPTAPSVPAVPPPSPGYGPPPSYAGGPPVLPGVQLPDSKKFKDYFGDPDFVRVASRVSGCMAGFWLLLSITTYFTSEFQWFTGALIFFAMFLVLEVLAIFLERQQAISSRLDKLDKFMRKGKGDSTTP